MKNGMSHFIRSYIHTKSTDKNRFTVITIIINNFYFVFYPVHFTTKLPHSVNPLVPHSFQLIFLPPRLFRLPKQHCCQ